MGRGPGVVAPRDEEGSRQVKSENWQQVKKVLAGALEVPAGERNAYLDHACPEPALRREVESLIAAHDQVQSSFLVQPAIPPKELPVGSRLGPYEIEARIGAGGMGEVYRAHDSRLGRSVAVKVLSPSFLDDEARLTRFRREARMLASLNHPNIVTLHSFEEAGGVHFLTMELVEGQPLNQLIPRGGLPVERIVELATAICDALAAAHEKGIVHRDLKPGNLMVTPGSRVKVLDFGLAKEVRATGEETLLTMAGFTEVGMVLGTPPYCSPEQVAGRELDRRSDIFSLGTTLYEMACGQRPFQGNSAAELATAILRDAPRPLGDLRPGLPDGFCRTVERCLEKNAADRFQSAGDVRSALLEIGAANPARGSRPASAQDGFWVAVLPFDCRGTSDDLRALAEGLSEDIVTGLSRFSYLRVIARSSTVRYAGAAADVRAVGKELGARYVMEGSLRQAGGALRIAVQLVEATSGAHLWADSYDRSLGQADIFTIQDDVVPRIVSTVADTYGVLPRTMSEALRSRNPDELTPYEAVLRSFAHFPRLAAEEHAAARAGLEHAVQQAPGYADALAMLSMLYRDEYAHLFNVRADPLGRALAAARRAVEAAPANHLAYHAMAAAQFFRREFPSFRNSAERAVALNPMDGFTLGYLGLVLAYSGEWERGCSLAERARGLNPHHPGWYWSPPAFDAYRRGDYGAALHFALKVNMPGYWQTHLSLATAYAQLGEGQAAASAVRDLLAVRPDFATKAREILSHRWQPELAEHLIEGLRKGGMQVE
jgi:serine/threonine protein kinase/tetratricopeptide (TPR) repeat protein